MKNKILVFAIWAQANWLALVILLLLIMMLFICIILGSWLFGFWSNGLHGTHFELQSCWTGIGAVVAGLGGVASLATAAWSKYHTDSKFNSATGIMPHSVVTNKEEISNVR